MTQPGPSNRLRMVLRIVAIAAGAGALFLTYEGFEGVWEGQEKMWIAPVFLAFLAIGIFLWEEEIGAKHAERLRTEHNRERRSSVEKQQPHGSRPTDPTI